MEWSHVETLLSQIQIEPSQVPLPNDQVGYLRKYVSEKDRNVSSNLKQFIDFLQTPVDDPVVWSILVELYGQRSFTIADVYEAIKILETNTNDPYMSYKVVDGKVILYMPKEKWQRWVMDVYERLSEKEKEEISKITKDLEPYKIYKAMKFLSEKNRGR